MYRAQRSSSNSAKEQQKGANRSSSFYSATNRFFYRFRTVRPFRLNGWGVSYNGKGRSIFVSFRKNGTIKLYCHIPYMEDRDRTGASTEVSPCMEMIWYIALDNPALFWTETSTHATCTS